MILSSSRFKNNKEKEELLVFFIKDDDGTEQGRLSFYLNEKDSSMKRELKESIIKLPKFIEDIYNLGKKGVEITFDNNEITMN